VNLKAKVKSDRERGKTKREVGHEGREIEKGSTSTASYDEVQPHWTKTVHRLGSVLLASLRNGSARVGEARQGSAQKKWPLFVVYDVIKK